MVSKQIATNKLNLLWQCSESATYVSRIVFSDKATKATICIVCLYEPPQLKNLGFGKQTHLFSVMMTRGME